MTGIPGTFVNRPPKPVRDRGPRGLAAEAVLRDMGALTVECYRLGEVTVTCSREPRRAGGYGWHVSIAHPSRYPDWDEVKTVVYGIELIALPPGHTFAQLLGNPEGGPWVDTHRFCFHLFEIEDPWRTAEGQ